MHLRTRPVLRPQVPPSLSSQGVPLTCPPSLPVQDVPLGVPIHNIELRAGRGGCIARAANTNAVILSKQEKFATVRLPSGSRRGGGPAAVVVYWCP